MEEAKRKQEMDIDYLAPFLAQIGNPEKLTRQQAYRLKEDCLSDLKKRLIDKANLIQARYEKVCSYNSYSGISLWNILCLVSLKKLKVYAWFAFSRLLCCTINF